VTLGRHIRHNVGEIARLLKEDFGKFSEDCFAAEKHEWNHAIRFLLAAAALRPALLAPNTGAATILRSLRMKEGLSELYAYCQIISDYGDRLQALDPNSLKEVKDHAAWQSDMDSLLQEVKAWSTRSPLMTTSYVPATRVWRKWQEPDGIIHSLLKAITENTFNKLEDVKDEVERLSDETQIKREVEYTAERS
jgi:hypothetical protein